MTDSTNPRVMADNIRELDARSLGTAAEVEALQIFDDAETDTGKKWIDGKSIFRKVFEVASFPNATSVDIPHGISDLGDVIDLYAMKFPVGTGSGYKSNYASTLQVKYNATNITVTTNTDSSAANGFILIEYTKTPTP